MSHGAAAPVKDTGSWASSAFRRADVALGHNPRVSMPPSIYLSILSCPVLSCPVLSCPVLSYPILSYPIYLPIDLSVRQSVHPSIRLSVYPSIRPSIHLSICPSIHLSFLIYPLFLFHLINQNPINLIVSSI